jgi:hypothetical protein
MLIEPVRLKVPCATAGTAAVGVPSSVALDSVATALAPGVGALLTSGVVVASGALASGVALVSAAALEFAVALASAFGLASGAVLAADGALVSGVALAADGVRSAAEAVEHAATVAGVEARRTFTRTSTDAAARTNVAARPANAKAVRCVRNVAARPAGASRARTTASRKRADGSGVVE